MQPFSENIIFLDTEFSDLDPYKGEIISIALVKLNGRSLYLELEHEGKFSPWVKKNVLPKMTKKKITRAKAVEKIKKFVGTKKPHAVGFVPQYDMVYLNKLFGSGKHPFHWMSIDFASILFGNGIPPKGYLSNKGKRLEKLGIDAKKYNKHNALDDALLLRETYTKFFKHNQ